MHRVLSGTGAIALAWLVWPLAAGAQAPKPPAPNELELVLGKFDKSKDGALEGEEWNAVPEQLRDNLRREVDVFKPVPIDTIAELVRRRATRTFESLDRNRDGAIDLEEWDRSRTTRGQFEKGGVDLREPVEREDFLRYYSRSYAGASDVTRPAKTESEERLTRFLPEPYRPFDVDLDNQVGLYEWPRSGFAEFFAMDRNRDGFLTPRELHAIMPPAEDDAAEETRPAIPAD